MHTKNKKTSGFTLIELLVVISIIGVLASVVLASLNSARIKARDVRRIADLNQIQLALNLYYDANNAYPSVAAWVTSVGGALWLPGISPVYIATVPVDPLNIGCSPIGPAGTSPWGGGSNYCYVYGYPQNGFPQKYDLVALLEDSANPQRCGVRAWVYHTGAAAETSWCGPGQWSFSPFMYADH